MPPERRSSIPSALTYDASRVAPPPHHRVTDRCMWYVKPGEPLKCFPGTGHRIADSDLASGKVRCKYLIQGKPRTAGVECGVLLWVLMMPKGFRWVAQVTHHELRYFEEQGMDIAAIFEYLGATGPLRAA